LTAQSSAAADFIKHNTVLMSPALAPGIVLHLATKITPLWQASEAFLAQHNVAPPFWAFAWPGSQALAWYIARHPELVAGRHVLDFAAGCGLAAIACAQAGAVVDAVDIDPLAVVAMAMNAAANAVNINLLEGDIVGSACRWDVILCGDVCYEAPMAAHILPWLRACAAECIVIMADPKRAYAPQDGFSELARISVPTLLELEDSTAREVVLLRF
jgi:predicted nicotinamide N-methyase